jgi:uncharacterized protein
MTRNAVNWFEIPVTDLARAQRFYETLLGTALTRETMGGEQMAIFPTEGTRVSFDAGVSIDAVLSLVAAAGGRVATPKTALPPGMGFFAHIEDSEGNIVGLHAMA